MGRSRFRRNTDLRSKLSDYQAMRHSRAGFRYDLRMEKNHRFANLWKGFISTLPIRLFIAAGMILLFSLLVRFNPAWAGGLVNTAGLFFGSEGELRDLSAWRTELEPVWNQLVSGSETEYTLSPGGGAILPVDGGQTQSLFGETRPGFTGEQELNYGIDFSATAGATVRSVAPGRISQVGFNPRLGNFVTVDHGNGVASYYCYLQNISVESGVEVAGGDPLGELGEKEILHFEVRREGVPVDPLSFFQDEEGGSSD